MTETPISDEALEARAPTWHPIDTAPKDGQRVAVTHSQCAKGYGRATGVWDEAAQSWVCSEAFIAPSMRLYWQPDLWHPLPLPHPPVGSGS